MAEKYGDDKRKKKIIIISVSSLLLIAMVIGVTVGVTHYTSKDAKTGPKGDVSTSMKAVQAICQPTDYKQACIDSLSKANSDDPKELIKFAFKVAMEKISDAAKRSTTLKALEKDKRASQALSACKELMEDAISDLKNSFERVGEFDITDLDEMLADLKIWLSATITYQETCLDGFQNTTGTAGEKMRTALKTASQLTSNGLAMVSEISTVLSSLEIPGISRRLLSVDTDVSGHGDEFPYWLNQNGRKLLSEPAEKIKPDATVAKDGSGDFKTINEALLGIPKNNKKQFVIYVKKGVYDEHVLFTKHMTNVMMFGDGPELTKITGKKNWVDGTPTFKTATVAVLGDFFVGKDMSIENTAGALKHQAVALRVQSDKSVFHNCKIDGYQDTLYVHAKRQYYHNCTVSGTIDFVFGDAAAVFQNCTFVVRKPLENQRCIVTAQGRNNTRQTSGLIIQGSRFTADPEYYPVRFENKAYLGRPWKEFSRTIIMESFIEDLIQPEGWLPWEGNFALKTLFYSEFKNRGPGSSKAQRVKWPGIKRLSAEHVKKYTAASFIEADAWIPSTGVPYVPGLMSKYTDKPVPKKSVSTKYVSSKSTKSNKEKQ